MVTNQGVPNPGYPFIDSTGKINPIWFQFLVNLWQRTGGGSNQGNVQSISVASSGGILSSVTNPTSMPEIILSLNPAAIPQLSLFTSSSSGIVPPSGGGSTNFLCADATWDPVVTNVSVTTSAGVSGSVANPTTTPAITIILGNITPLSVVATNGISGTTGTFSSTMQFGAYTNTPIVNTGYVTINDAGGTPRRLMVG